MNIRRNSRGLSHAHLTYTYTTTRHRLSGAKQYYGRPGRESGSPAGERERGGRQHDGRGEAGSGVRWRWSLGETDNRARLPVLHQQRPPPRSLPRPSADITGSVQVSPKDIHVRPPVLQSILHRITPSLSFSLIIISLPFPSSLKVMVYVLTFIGYATYHMSRKPFSVVKVRICM